MNGAISVEDIGTLCHSLDVSWLSILPAVNEFFCQAACVQSEPLNLAIELYAINLEIHAVSCCLQSTTLPTRTDRQG